MDCAEFMKLMSSYLDGELEESLQAERESHLTDYPDCQAKVIDFPSNISCLDERCHASAYMPYSFSVAMA